MNPPTDWASAIVIAVAGLILGLLFVVFFNKRKSAKKLGGEADLELRDLIAKRDALVAQLRDPALDPEERTRLEHQTADVLRKLDGRKDVLPSVTDHRQPTPDTPGSAMNPAVKGFLWGAASFAALAGLGWFVYNQSTPRGENGSLTGGFESGPQAGQQPGQPGAPDPALQQLLAAVEKDPDNLQLRNDLAQAYLERENLMAVFEQTKLVLAKSPDDSRALTFQGLVRMAMGEGEEAQRMLERATKSNPKNLDSWVALAWIHAQHGRMGDAEKMIAEAAKQSPQDKDRLDAVFREMRAQATQQQNQPAQTAMGGDLPAGHPPVDGAPTPAAAPAAQSPMGARPAPPADGRSIQVTLDLDPAAAQKSGILYVMARNPMGGPPIAVKRLQATAFPITFAFGSADSMMGQPLPDKFRLEARLDSDGDAATKPPTDPSASQNDVTPGATIKLALK